MHIYWDTVLKGIVGQQREGEDKTPWDETPTMDMSVLWPRGEWLSECHSFDWRNPFHPPEKEEQCHGNTALKDRTKRPGRKSPETRSCVQAMQRNTGDNPAHKSGV